MKRTVMAAERGGRIVIETGDNGTQVTDAEGVILAEHGSDRHEEMVALRRDAGLGVLEEGDVRPEEARHAPPPAEGPAGPAGEVDAGPSS
jgi:hypothetical protein